MTDFFKKIVQRNQIEKQYHYHNQNILNTDNEESFKYIGVNIENINMDESKFNDSEIVIRKMTDQTRDNSPNASFAGTPDASFRGEMSAVSFRFENKTET